MKLKIHEENNREADVANLRINLRGTQQQRRKTVNLSYAGNVALLTHRRVPLTFEPILSCATILIAKGAIYHMFAVLDRYVFAFLVKQ